MNKVIILGNLVADPEKVTFQNSETKLSKFRVAVNGYKKDDVIFVDVQLWAKLATVANEYLSKGKKVLVEGRLSQDVWETSDGEKRQKLYITGERLEMLSPKEDDNGDQENKTPPNKTKPSQTKKQTESVTFEDDDIPF